MVLSQLVLKQFGELTWRPSELLPVTLWVLCGVTSPLSAVLHFQQSLCAAQRRCTFGCAALEESEPRHLGMLQLLPGMLPLPS